MSVKAEVLASACKRILQGQTNEAREILSSQYSFLRPERSARKYSQVQVCRVFFRDGFIDRYSGHKLIFPPVLRLLSALFPQEFPFHPNWRMDQCHIAYWELSPTIDHVVPVARGGSSDDSNFVTTSMLRNSVKANWTLEELGWKLVPVGNCKGWDGLTRWFLDYTSANPDMLKNKYYRAWRRAADEASK